ncbi:MAG: hypothetical protein IH988_04885 [Planctomycetes bacterium]|nr:hypothetical protein [Planctomycetota bacterium]
MFPMTGLAGLPKLREYKSKRISSYDPSGGNRDWVQIGAGQTKTIADWTIDSLQDSDEGFFYYRKYRHFRNKTSYMRWGQAWMLLALTTLLKTLQDHR